MDGYGSWGNANGSYHLFNVNRDERTVTRLDRGRNIDERRKCITDFDFKVCTNSARIENKIIEFA